MGYSPWGRKESDRTERLNFHFQLSNGTQRFSGKRLCYSDLRWLPTLV